MTLKQLRERENITQKTMATKLDISESYYCLLENGKRNISLNRASIIAKQLNVTIDDVFLSSHFAKCKENNPA